MDYLGPINSTCQFSLSVILEHTGDSCKMSGSFLLNHEVTSPYVLSKRYSCEYQYSQRREGEVTELFFLYIFIGSKVPEHTFLHSPLLKTVGKSSPHSTEKTSLPLHSRRSKWYFGKSMRGIVWNCL